jgi:hypothetical protein
MTTDVSEKLDGQMKEDLKEEFETYGEESDEEDTKPNDPEEPAKAQMEDESEESEDDLVITGIQNIVHEIEAESEDEPVIV